ncbi:TrkH family potassium uptake protein [uncultured Anaerovibrio sp.]|uniref:TrkH family potassium uptake protein n=1 Tax=uncultured Anaerovibrio sp. TaxID=361586 RepID=UPI002636FC7D|nr:TrkH family potassium uptake protein [uncultured Anaerovibrio sp.]
MSYPVIYYMLSRLMFAMSVTLLIPFFTAIQLKENNELDFLAAIVCSLCLSVFFSNRGKITTKDISIREGIAITGLSWLFASIIASLPFLAGHYMPVVDCLFEGVSGITGSGASVVKNIPDLPTSIMLWRSLTHWLGGLGIIVIFIAIVPQTGTKSLKMFEVETTGPTETRPLPRFQDTAHALLMVYIFLTFILTALLLLCGFSFSDAVNNAMSAIATGGFSTKNESIGYFDNLPAEIVLTIAMLVGGGNFSLYLIAWKQGYHKIIRDSEFLAYVALFGTLSLAITVNLFAAMDMNLFEALRYATFQTAATISTTGFANSDFDSWPAFSKYCLLIVMITGGCAGSTSGGMKIARFIMMFKLLHFIILEKLHPNQIIHVKYDTVERMDTLINKVGRFFFLYVFLALLGALIFTIEGLPIMDAIVLGFSAIGNAGVAFGAANDFSTLNDMTKYICCGLMVIGRLEIFLFLVMLKPSFWQKGASW